MTPAGTPRPDYGIDAPGVIRNLLLAAAIALGVWLSTVFGLWSGHVWIFDIRPMALSMGAAFAATAAVMLYYSKFGKFRGRERLLDRLSWTGSENVLDIGCGRGLMLIGAAKRLRNGRAVGIDIWQTEDLSGNRPEATLENARREGVADRVEVRTADMRELPFESGSFDTVVSCAAIHNLYQPADRAKALAEIARVLKPGGQVLIADIRHLREYADILAKHSVPVRLVGPIWQTVLTALITWGAVRSNVLLGRKSLAA